MGRHDASSLLASFRENYQDLLRFLVRRTGSAEHAADLVQDTYVRLAGLAPGGAEIENPRAFIYRVARNLAIDRMRREGRISRDLAVLESGEAVPDPTPSPEAVSVARDRLRSLEAALDDLPERLRLALLMARVEGRSFRDIAQRLRVSESMVAKYIAQALRHCRDRLRDDGE